MAKNVDTILIAGAGIGGLTAGVILADAGFKVKIFEAAPEARPVGAGLALSANAVKVLRRVSLEEPLQALSCPIRMAEMKTAKGQTLGQANLRKINKKYGAANVIVHRADLHRLLESALGKAELHYNSRINGWYEEGGQIKIKLEDGRQETGDLLIAADGIKSFIRQKLFPGSTPRYAGYTCWRGVTQIDHPELSDTVSSESFANGTRFGISPLPGNRFYWYAVANAPEGASNYGQQAKHKLLEMFAPYHFPIKELIQSTPEENIIWNDLHDIKPLRRFHKGLVVLLGDAAHATTPNLGQGAAMAIEDAAILTSCLVKNRQTEDALQMYSKMRVARTARVIRESRRFGSILHWTNPALSSLRNRLIRSRFTSSKLSKSMKWILKFEL